MSRSHISHKLRNAITHTAAVVALLVASMMATGCDGGLFGTGDGSDANADILATDMGVPAGITTESPTDLPDSSMESETVGSAEQTDDENITQQILSFSNTLPSGLSSQTTPLSALKVINLTEVAVNATALNSATTDVGVDTQPDTTSEWLSISIGETDISLSTVDDSSPFAVISPLNSAEDSLTSIVISGSIDSPDLMANANGGSSVSVLALETRAAVSASGMAEVRLVRTAVPSANDTGTTNSTPLSDQYLLTPATSNINGVELVFTTLTDTSAQISSYQLTSPGDYSLSGNGETAPSQQLSLEANTVYTLIVSTEPQRPVFVEVDSRLPVPD